MSYEAAIAAKAPGRKDRWQDYGQFIAGKRPSVADAGFAVAPSSLSPMLFPFQREVVTWACRRGRSAIFADCGLGKTPMQLEWARLVGARTGGQVLVLAPLVVAQQTIREGAKFGIEVRYAREQSEATAITVANYERLDRFRPEAFAGVVLDESSILKAYTGKTKRSILASFAATPYKLACTATPAPNDHLELGNHAEFLGVMSSHEMIARFFVKEEEAGEYRLKRHAIVPYWDWVFSWARCLGVPSDLGPGFDDAGFVLPRLDIRHHVLDVDRTVGADDGALFRNPELNSTSLHRERRLTLGSRVAAVARLVAAEPAEPWIVWCETDVEADALCAAIPGAVEVRGPMRPDEKERRLIAFSEGAARVLVTKPSIAGFGLNWQHCARVAFVGPGFSFESYCQAVRRCWRFGQTRDVQVHVVMAETERRVWQVVARKASDHEAIKRGMFDAARRAAANESKTQSYQPRCKGRMPEWLRTR